ncbi:MAG: DUF4040 domain-containing protein [Methanobacteriaceae archaeon]|nr:DUF4040 domain-containing protein [Methanobacteriaceae archaeon]
MIEWLIFVIAIVGAILCLMQEDLLKMAVLTSVTGLAIAFLYQFLQAPDVALTQAVVGSAIVPAFVALAIMKTQRVVEKKEDS